MEKRKSFIITSSYYILIIIIGYLFAKYVFNIIFPLLIGLYIAVFLKPYIIKFRKRTKMPEKTAKRLVLLIFYIIIVAIIYIFGAFLYKNISNIKIPDISILEYIEIETLKDIFRSFIDIIGSITKQIALYITSVIKTFPSVLINFFLIIISSYIFVMDYEIIKNFIKKTSSYMTIKKIKNIIISITYLYIKSYTILFIVTFLEVFVWFYFLDVNNFLELSVLIAIFDAIPAIGIGFFIIPMIVYNLIIENFSMAFLLIIMYITCVVIRNIIEPKILSKEIGINPIITMISMIIGGRVCGFLGFLFAPIAICIVKKIYIKDNLL